jgi:predicted nucleic acid-binding protein
MSPKFVKLRAVVDSSCLRCLLILDLAFPDLNLLRALQLRYETIHIPHHVWNEVGRRGHKRTQLRQLVRDHPFFTKCSFLNQHNAQLLYDPLLNPLAPIDRGEAEAIIQARELGVVDVLIDERKGTRIALAHSLNPRGIIALVKEFKLNDVVSEIRPLLEECQRNRFWIDKRLMQKILEEVGES